MRAGFLMDPIETVIVGHDTTFAFMVECQRRKHEVFTFEQKDLSYRDGGPVARMRRVSVQKVKGAHFQVLADERLPLSKLDAVFLRKDPPVDVEYLHATQLVELARGPFLLNDPQGLRDANEKLYALQFPGLCPRTVVSRDKQEILVFLEDVGGEMILKPVDGFGGLGILHVKKGDRNLNSMVEIATAGGRTATVAQEYLPASREGDKRIVLLDGEPLGALLRIPQDGDVRGNLAAGARSKKTTITDRDREICRRLAPDLRRRGLWFVGLDIIGTHLTEVNVTSPTGIEEIDALDGVSVEAAVIDFVERKAGEKHGGKST
jgi:glutathione synthase